MQVGDVLSALEVLALIIGDVKRAQLLCQDEGNLDAYLTLLKLLLHPGDGRPPMYVEACRLLTAEGIFTRAIYGGLNILRATPPFCASQTNKAYILGAQDA